MLEQHALDDGEHVGAVPGAQSVPTFGFPLRAARLGREQLFVVFASAITLTINDQPIPTGQRACTDADAAPWDDMRR